MFGKCDLNRLDLFLVFDIRTLTLLLSDAFCRHFEFSYHIWFLPFLDLLYHPTCWFGSINPIAPPSPFTTVILCMVNSYWWKWAMSLFNHKYSIKISQTDLQLLDEQFVDTSWHVTYGKSQLQSIKHVKRIHKQYFRHFGDHLTLGSYFEYGNLIWFRNTLTAKKHSPKFIFRWFWYWILVKISQNDITH